MRLTVPLVFALILAGCATPGTDDDGGAGIVDPTDLAWALRALPSADSHDHNDPAQHANITTPNFQVVGWDPLVTDALGNTAGGHYCGGAAETEDGRRLAVVHSFDETTNVAFVLVDVTDPAAPMKLGEFMLDNVHIYDSTISPDGRFVVLGANPQLSAPSAGFALASIDTTTVQPLWRDACTGVVSFAGPEQPLPLAPGVILVDVSDPAAPTFADFAPTPVLGPHSVHAADLDRNLFLASITNLEHQASYFQFYQVEELPLLGPKLRLMSTYQGPPGPQSTIPLINGHVDGYIAEHPATGQTLAWLANWDGGVIVLDISNVQVPVEVARWGGAANGPASFGDEAAGGIHGTYPLPTLWDDKHYTMAGQELGGHPEGRPTGWIFILDTTDPAAPTEVARWTLPVDVNWSGFLQFSTHYFTVVDRTMFVAMYHGGVWAVDLTDPANPRTVGAWIPDRESPSPPANPGYDEVLDVIALGGGDLLSFGSRSGAYVLRFDAANPMAPVTEWATQG